MGAYGGKREIMEKMAPIGSVYQAGTLSGNPLAMTAGITTLSALGQPGVYEQLENTARRLEAGITRAAAASGVEVNISRVASLLTIFFTGNAALNYQSVAASDTVRFGRFFWQLLEQGIYWPPSQFEAAFISLAHSEKDIETTVAAISTAFKSLTA